jgi:hypothetical protein
LNQERNREKFVDNNKEGSGNEERSSKESQPEHASDSDLDKESNGPKVNMAVQLARESAALLQKGGAGIATFAVTLAVVLAIAGVLAYWGWFRGIPFVWAWGFDDWGFRKIGKSFLALFGVYYLAIFPFISLTVVGEIFKFWNAFLSRRGALRREVKSARSSQEEIERDLASNDTDPHQIVLVLKYSRRLLGEYYAIGMHQAQRSYRYALFAMWLGFAVLLVGVGDQLGWLAAAFPSLPTETDSASSQDVVLLTGAVIEFIAVAFLWIYRTSMEQQILFYARQLKLHKTLLAYRLSLGMSHKSDEAVATIISKLLEEGSEPNIAAPGGSSGISKLLDKSS